MSKDKISDYSATANSNTDIAGINIDEGCAPSGINNAIRTLMKQIKDLYAGTSGDKWPVAAGGTGGTTASEARTNLGLVIGTDVQAYDAQLTDIAGLTPTDNGVVIGDGTNFVVESGATLKTSLGLTIGTDVQAYNAELQGISQGGNIGMKNRIINGAMMIDQRNAGSSVTLTNQGYGLDRWTTWFSQVSKYTVQQNQNSVTPPAGYAFYQGVTSSSAYSVISTDYFGIGQKIEGYNINDLAWGTSSAQSITISFWVRSSLTGTFGIVLRNASGDYYYATTYTISSANTWEQKSVTIPGPTVGTWGTSNGIGIFLMFGLGMGSSQTASSNNTWINGGVLGASGAQSLVGTNGATFYITGVQLEKGSTATSFDYRPYGTELALCQRYFISYGGTAAYERMATCINNATTNSIPMFTFPVEMRAAPTFGYSSTSHFGIYNGSSVIAVTSFGGDAPSTKVATMSASVASGLTQGATNQFLANNTTSARATWSAEL